MRFLFRLFISRWLLRISGAVFISCAIIFAVLFFGMSHDYYKEPLMALFGVPFLLSIVGITVFWGTFFWTYVSGFPTYSIVYSFLAGTRNWRGVFGILLMTGVLASVTEVLAENFPFINRATCQSESPAHLSDLLSAGDASAAFKRGDYEKAFQFSCPFAEAGDKDAQIRLGLMYAEGKGVAQDYAQAAKWLRKAADQGNAVAQFGLGALYEDGQDYAQAATWYRKAANQGYASAQYNLGLLYNRGYGVTQNFEEAYFWLILGATSGGKNFTTARDDGARHLTPQQVSEVQKRASYWKPQRN